MKTRSHIAIFSKATLVAGATLLCLSGVVLPAAAQEEKSTPVASEQTTQKAFATPQEAADSLIEAAGANDVSALKEILGPGSDDIISSEDEVQDKNRAADFVAKAQEKKSVEIDPDNSKRATLYVGESEWPLPVPIVKRDGKWYFDSKAGREEILLRRIGTNELDAIEICRGYVEAQEEYSETKHDNSKVNQYAQKIISSPGKQDGLAWKNADGTWGGPVGEEAAKALAEGYSDKTKPYHGYYFKVLKGQGPAASMGEMDFVQNGAMIGGFALVAAPADYRVTGVQTFIVNQSGDVYQKDLGSDTLKVFNSMDRYNPDKTWQKTEEELEE
jgi:Protein of unknown function (DUF2950)